MDSTGKTTATAKRSLSDPGAILTSIGEAVYDWDLATDALRWSPGAVAVLKLDRDAPIATGRDYHEQTAPASVTSRREAVLGDKRTDSGAGVAYHVRYALQTCAGGRPETIWIDDTGRWFGGADGRPERAHGLVRVASARGNIIEIGASVADFDPLTGCVARARMLQMLETMVTRRAAARMEWGLLLIEIDDLAKLNRQHGYDAVDELIVGAASALRSQIRSSDWLARYAGNTFALVLDHCDPAQIEPAAARALDLVSRTAIATSAGPLYVRAHAGAVVAPRHGRTLRALLMNAETATAAAGRAALGAGPRIALYDPSCAVQDEARRAEELADAIVAALNDGRVRIALQPVLAARSREIAMHEALVRIVLPDGEVLAPSAILPAAEKAGLMQLVDQRVLDLVAAHLSANAGTVSVNVSGATLADPDWPARITSAVQRYPGIASRLIVEAAEATAMEDLAASVRSLAAVRGTGVRVAIDDFGVGHASLRDLRRLSPDFVKIDGALVQNIASSPDDRFVVRSLLGIARHLGASTVAEWVESPDIADTLTGWGVSYLQGMHLGRAALQKDEPRMPALSWMDAAVA